MTTDLDECETHGAAADLDHVALHVLGNQTLYDTHQCQLGASCDCDCCIIYVRSINI